MHLSQRKPRSRINWNYSKLRDLDTNIISNLPDQSMVFLKIGNSGLHEMKRYLFGMVEALEVILTEKRAVLGLSAVRHTFAEIHPEIVASPFVPRYSPSRRHLI